MRTEEWVEKVESELASAKRSRLLIGLVIVALIAVWVLSGAAWGETAIVALVTAIVAWVLITREGVGGPGQRSTPGTAGVIRTRQIIVEDDAGQARALLATHKDEARLALYDQEGHVRATLVVQEHGPRLTLWDDHGRATLSAGVTAGGPRLVMEDATGETRALLAVTVNVPRLVLYDHKGNAIWRTP